MKTVSLILTLAVFAVHRSSAADVVCNPPLVRYTNCSDSLALNCVQEGVKISIRTISTNNGCKDHCGCPKGKILVLGGAQVGQCVENAEKVKKETCVAQFERPTEAPIVCQAPLVRYSDCNHGIYVQCKINGTMVKTITGHASGCAQECGCPEGQILNEEKQCISPASVQEYCQKKLIATQPTEVPLGCKAPLVLYKDCRHGVTFKCIVEGDKLTTQKLVASGCAQECGCPDGQALSEDNVCIPETKTALMEHCIKKINEAKPTLAPLNCTAPLALFKECHRGMKVTCARNGTSITMQTDYDLNCGGQVCGCPTGQLRGHDGLSCIPDDKDAIQKHCLEQILGPQTTPAPLQCKAPLALFQSCANARRVSCTKNGSTIHIRTEMPSDCAGQVCGCPDGQVINVDGSACISGEKDALKKYCSEHILGPRTTPTPLVCKAPLILYKDCAKGLKINCTKVGDKIQSISGYDLHCGGQVCGCPEGQIITPDGSSCIANGENAVQNYCLEQLLGPQTTPGPHDCKAPLALFKDCERAKKVTCKRDGNRIVFLYDYNPNCGGQTCGCPVGQLIAQDGSSCVSDDSDALRKYCIEQLASVTAAPALECKGDKVFREASKDKCIDSPAFSCSSDGDVQAVLNQFCDNVCACPDGYSGTRGDICVPSKDLLQYCKNQTGAATASPPLECKGDLVLREGSEDKCVPLVSFGCGPGGEIMSGAARVCTPVCACPDYHQRTDGDKCVANADIVQFCKNKTGTPAASTAAPLECKKGQVVRQASEDKCITLSYLTCHNDGSSSIAVAQSCTPICDCPEGQSSHGDVCVSKEELAGYCAKQQSTPATVTEAPLECKAPEVLREASENKCISLFYFSCGADGNSIQSSSAVSCQSVCACPEDHHSGPGGRCIPTKDIEKFCNVQGFEPTRPTTKQTGGQKTTIFQLPLLEKQYFVENQIALTTAKPGACGPNSEYNAGCAEYSFITCKADAKGEYDIQSAGRTKGCNTCICKDGFYRFDNLHGCMTKFEAQKKCGYILGVYNGRLPKKDGIFITSKAPKA